MGFLAPWFLAGAAALGLPVYIHLLRQHKTEPLPFSSLMFFEQRTQSSIKHRRLRYLLLMALRLALLALIVLGFAGPFWKSNELARKGEPIIVLAIDESFSMRSGSHLADAKREALRWIAGKGGARAQVMALGQGTRLLTQVERDAGTLRAAVESIQPTDGKASFGEFARAVRSIAAAEKAPIEAHLFSDLQQTALPTGFSDLQMPDGAKLVLHSVAAKGAANWAVETVIAPSTIWDTKKARLQVTVAGYGAPASTRNVTLAANGRVVASKPVNVPANGRATVEFIGLDAPYGLVKGEARIDASDALAADNAMRFALERADPKKGLMIHESRDGQSPLYFRAALGSAGEAAFSLDAVAVEQAGGLNLSRYSFVIVADVLSLPANVEDQLKNYVNSGGSILVAMGPASARRGKIPVIGDAMSEGRYYARDGARFDTVGEVDRSFAPVGKAANWEGVKFYYVVKTDARDARVLARLTDRTPLLFERRVGEGRVVVFTSGLDKLTNDFPLFPAFVAFTEQMARYLAGVEDQRSATPVGGNVELRAARERSVSVEVIDPEGKRPLSLTDAAKAQSFTVDREGFYEVRRANGRHEMIAVNADRRESDLTPITEETQKLWSATGAQPPAAADAGALEKSERVRPFWWPLLLLAAAAAIAESIYASRYLGVEQEA